jgi:hypothetical protein
MPPSSQSTQVVRQRQAPRDVTLRSWPIAAPAAGPKLLLVGGLLLAWLAGMMSGSAATGFVLAAGILLALWRVWLPVRFEIGPFGVTQHCLGRQRRIPWSSIGRAVRQSAGLLVLPNAQPAPLESLRSLYIPFGNQQADIVAAFEYYLSGREAE